MIKDKSAVVERLRAKIQPDNLIFVRKNLEISDQISDLLKEKGWTQKDLAGKNGACPPNKTEFNSHQKGLKRA